MKTTRIFDLRTCLVEQTLNACRIHLNRKLIAVASLLMMCGASIIQAQEWPIPQAAFGVWDKRGEYLYNEKIPSHVKGMGLHLDWAELQPHKSNESYFDWSYFEDAIEWAAKKKVSVYFKVYPVTGGGKGREDSFPVFFDNKDKDVYVESWNVNGHWYPDYKSDNYFKHYKRMIQAFGDWVDDLPNDQKKWVSHIFVQTGAHGDPGPYKTWDDAKKIPSKKQFDKDTWQKWRLNEFFPAYKKAFQENGRRISLAFNGANPTQEDTKVIYQWIDKNIVNYGLKPSNRNARGTHLHDEIHSIDWYRPRSIDPKGKIVFSFNEFTGVDKKEVASENHSMYTFWSMVNALQCGISIVDASSSNISNPVFKPHFEFYNKYAGQIFAEEANNAYIFFHEGLDMADYDNFPENTYGSYKKDADARLGKMWELYAKQYGARKAEKNLKEKKHDKTEMNDFGLNIQRENYARFLKQYKPNDTSVPAWRVENPGEKFTNKSSIYSRFGRSINANSNKDAIYVNFSKNFFIGGHDGSYPVEFSVRYFDKGDGKFTFYYDSKNGSNKAAKSISLSNSKNFKIAKIVVSDGRFDGQGKNGSDFSLVADKGSIVITSVEVHRDKTDQGGDPEDLTLTVKNGSGSGSYGAGESVNIEAYEPEVNQVFDQWVVSADNPPYIDDVTQSSTTLTMGSSDAKVTATYKSNDDDGGDSGNDDNCYTGDIALELYTDRKGSDTSWTLKNDSGKTLYTSKKYANKTLYQKTFELSAGKYKFKIEDGAGNGMCCGKGDGYYELRDAFSELIVRGGDFGESEKTNFCVK